MTYETAYGTETLLVTPACVNRTTETPPTPQPPRADHRLSKAHPGQWRHRRGLDRLRMGCVQVLFGLRRGPIQYGFAREPIRVGREPMVRRTNREGTQRQTCC